MAEEEIDSGRVEQPKHTLTAEARATAPYRKIREAICKSYKKFRPGEQNLLIVTNDLFKPIAMDPLPISAPQPPMSLDIRLALYNANDGIYDGLGFFKKKDYENLGGILFLNNRCPEKLFAWFEANPNAMVPMSNDFIVKALQLNKLRSKCAQNDYIKHNGIN